MKDEVANRLNKVAAITVCDSLVLEFAPLIRLDYAGHYSTLLHILKALNPIKPIQADMNNNNMAVGSN